MKVKLRDIIDAQTGLRQIMQIDQPPGAAFYFLDLAQAVTPKVDNYNQQRLALVERLGVPMEGTELKHVPVALPDKTPNPNFAEFEKLFNELMDKDIELPGIESLPRDKLGQSQLKPSTLLSLGVFIAKPAESAA